MGDRMMSGISFGTSGIVNSGVSTYASPDVSQHPINFYPSGQNKVDSYTSTRVTGPDQSDIDAIKGKVSPDEIIMGIDYELKHMFYKNKAHAKQVVVTNLKKDPTYYSKLNMLNIGDEFMNEKKDNYKSVISDVNESIEGEIDPNNIESLLDNDQDPLMINWMTTTFDIEDALESGRPVIAVLQNGETFKVNMVGSSFGGPVLYGKGDDGKSYERFPVYMLSREDVDSFDLSDPNNSEVGDYIENDVEDQDEDKIEDLYEIRKKTVNDAKIYFSKILMELEKRGMVPDEELKNSIDKIIEIADTTSLMENVKNEIKSIVNKFAIRNKKVIQSIEESVDMNKKEIFKNIFDSMIQRNKNLNNRDVDERVLTAYRDSVERSKRKRNYGTW